jgi:hypothetical protein
MRRLARDVPSYLAKNTQALTAPLLVVAASTTAAAAAADRLHKSYLNNCRRSKCERQHESSPPHTAPHHGRRRALLDAAGAPG